MRHNRTIFQNQNQIETTFYLNQSKSGKVRETLQSLAVWRLLSWNIYSIRDILQTCQRIGLKLHEMKVSLLVYLIYWIILQSIITETTVD